MTKDLLALHPEIVLQPRRTLREAMQAMTRSRLGIVLVISRDLRLEGLLTDIDIRRALLRGAEMSDPVTAAMNRDPVTIPEGLSREGITDFFRKRRRAHIPVIDKRGRLKGLAALLNYAALPRRYPNWIVIMAGGAGKRLRPLTRTTPKPMLRIGDKPILELLLEQLISSGFGHFIFAINYLAYQIHAHFGDGSRWNVRIEYVHEKKPLGTVGALSLIRRKLLEPVIVANGDILTKVDFSALLDFHTAEEGLATLCVKHHEIQVPYGVVELYNHRLHALVEKPTHRFLVNAGIYVLEPAALRWLPRGKPCDMPDFLQKLRRHRSDAVTCFPIPEYWLDIGGMKEFRRANGEYGQFFAGA
jgi:dTDP-glucose pyrophosphorylase